MAARSIATLTLSFGLVSIPVRLYSATESASSIRFNLLGEMAYLAQKRLHLFATSMASSDIDPNACHCTSMFVHWKTGKELPEADGFAWVPLQKVREHCAARMGKLLVHEGVLRRAIGLVFQP